MGHGVRKFLGVVVGHEEVLLEGGVVLEVGGIWVDGYLSTLSKVVLILILIIFIIIQISKS